MRQVPYLNQILYDRYTLAQVHFRHICRGKLRNMTSQTTDSSGQIAIDINQACVEKLC